MDSEISDFQEIIDKTLLELGKYAEEACGIIVAIHTDPRYERKYNFILYDSFKEGRERKSHGSRGWICPHITSLGEIEWEINLAIDEDFDIRVYEDIPKKHFAPIHAVVRAGTDPRPIFQMMYIL